MQFAKSKGVVISNNLPLKYSSNTNPYFIMDLSIVLARTAQDNVYVGVKPKIIFKEIINNKELFTIQTSTDFSFSSDYDTFRLYDIIYDAIKQAINDFNALFIQTNSALTSEIVFIYPSFEDAKIAIDKSIMLNNAN